LREKKILKKKRERERERVREREKDKIYRDNHTERTYLDRKNKE
jgi:hypothetical protein